MARSISESNWKAFVKKQKLTVELDDKELLKALERFDKTDEHSPQPRLQALKDLAREIPRQVSALLKLKKALGDKPFGLVKDELYAILAEVEALQGRAQAALEAEDSEDPQDEDSRPDALVNPRLLLKQLTLCRNEHERRMKFAFVDAKDKQAAMLAMHPRMSARSLFASLQEAAGVRTGAYGTAWVDGMSLMLQLDKPLSGLVKKVRAPVRACGFRITRAVVWNPDGTVFEQDEQVEQDEQLQAKTTSTAESAAVGDGAAFKARLAALLPRLREARATGLPDALEASARATEAGMTAGKHDFVRAGQLLDEAEELLARRAADPQAPRPAGPGFDASAFRAAWQAARAAWSEAVETVDAQIAKLQVALREQGDEDLAEIAEFGLPALTGDFKAPMMAAVMDVDRAGDPELPAVARRARALAVSFAEYLDAAETVAVTDDNDFGVTVTIRKTIGGALRQLEQTLAAAAG